MSAPERLLSAEEVAELLAVRKQWVYSKSQSGEIPHFKLGHYNRYRLTEVMKWLEAQREAAR